MRADRHGIRQAITSLYLPARHDAITASSPAGVHSRPSKPTEAELVPPRGSQVVLLSRNDGCVLDLHPTRRQFLVSTQNFPSQFLDSFLEFSSKAYPPRFIILTAQLTMGQGLRGYREIYANVHWSPKGSCLVILLSNRTAKTGTEPIHDSTREERLPGHVRYGLRRRWRNQ